MRRLARRHGGRRQLLAMCLPLARLRPDVVQFEWNISAVDHLPLFGQSLQAPVERRIIDIAPGRGRQRGELPVRPRRRNACPAIGRRGPSA